MTDFPRDRRPGAIPGPDGLGLYAVETYTGTTYLLDLHARPHRVRRVPAGADATIGQRGDGGWLQIHQIEPIRIGQPLRMVVESDRPDRGARRQSSAVIRVRRLDLPEE